MKRRDFVKNSALASSLPIAMGALKSLAGDATSANPVSRPPGSLTWLEGGAPSVSAGPVWGQPWPQGMHSPKTAFSLQNAEGQSIPVQTWPTAYWPDGSVKWTAHASAERAGFSGQYTLKPGKSAAPESRVRVRERGKEIQLDTGVIRVTIPRSGAHIISEMRRGKKLLGRDAVLVAMAQDGAEAESMTTLSHFESDIKQVSVEQDGPVRAQIKIEGLHRNKSRSWLPFTLRIAAHAGADALQISHTFVFDGEPEADFLRGLGLRFSVEMHDEPYNRHVRFAGENGGLWAESPQGITGLRRDPGEAVRKAQVDGRATPPLSEWSKRVTDRLHWVPVWNDYTLSQLSANGFQIKKRTRAGHAWIDSDQGKRSAGSAYVGGASGGILFGMRDFWQLHPVQLDIRSAGASQAEATLWFYAPEAPAMDVRFYHDGLGQETYEDQLDALDITYEDYEPGFGTAQGIARSSDVTLVLMDSTPSRDEFNQWAEAIRLPGQLVVDPHTMLNSGVFGGLWSLPDYSSSEHKAIEDRLNWSVAFYHNQVDQRHWYGFWNYGDIMHTYDSDRHVWRYDVGGYAWDNSELSPDLWLWYSYLRTGDATTFRLAEAMTRHNRDVDIYHLGRFKGLGTRHNVQHWGCSAKQLRISTATYRRFHYFLTADARTGDVLDEVINADVQLANVVPTRKISGKKGVPTKARIGVGTDWGSAAANWLCAWERTGDPAYRKRLADAMQVIGSQPYGFFTGVFGYDTTTHQLIPPADPSPGISHLSAVFGLVEVCAELIQLIDDPEFRQAWLDYGRYYNAPDEVQAAALGKPMKGNSLTVAHSRLTAYTAAQENDPELARRAWQEFSREWGGKKPLQTLSLSGPDVLNPVDEAAWVSTNDASQWGLAAIQNLALVGKYLGE